jgi:predicted metalloprotease with PDZ domain
MDWRASMDLQPPTRRAAIWLLLGTITFGTFGLCCASRPHAQNALAPSSRQTEVAPSVIAYEVTPDLRVTPHLLHVTMTFRVPKANGKLEDTALQMPVWSPGDYHIQNFGKYVQNVRAVDPHVNLIRPEDQKFVPVTHPDANTWLIHTTDSAIQTGSVTVTYDLPETPRGYFSENVALRDRYAFVNGASALMYVVGHKNAPTTLAAQLPADWRAEMPLPQSGKTDAPDADKTNGGTARFTFTAPDYDTLADSPLVMADKNALRTTEFTLGGKIKTVYHPVYFGNLERLGDVEANNKTLERIARAETQIMGGAPNSLYEFIFEVNGRGGGLEHLNACRLPYFPGMNLEQAAPFVAHEFFHQWNVKRIRPRVLGPFDYVHPPHTRNLWFAEGVTDYYAWIATRRAGLCTADQFRAHWRQAIARMQRNPARLKITADDASLTVWESGNSEGNGGLSYYEKGALIGLCLDLKIRHLTKNQRSLDDVMRALLAQCAPPHPGYDEDGLRNTVNSVAGQDLTDFYNLLARSTQEMPFAECLSYAGLDANAAPLPDATPEQIALRDAWTTETN